MNILIINLFLLIFKHVFNKVILPLQTDHVIINKDSVEQIPWVPFPQLFVDKCHPKIQPYLKLMRIDRPIGKF